MEKEKNKNNRPYKVIVCLLCCFIGISAILGKMPFKKVKADATTSVRVSASLTSPSQIQFLILVFDAYEPEQTTIDVDLRRLYANGQSESYLEDSFEFLRFPALDIEDYDAYVYNRVVSNFERYNIFEYWIYADELGIPGVNNYTIFHIVSPYIEYNARMSGYDEGFEYGYADGYADGYGGGLEIGFRDGLTQGYADGYNAGESSQIDINFMQSIFTSLDAFFQIHFAPNLTIGELFLAPLIIWFVWFIIKQFKGGD